MKSFSLKAKLVSALLIAGLVPAVIISIYSFVNSSDALIAEVHERLKTSREARAFQVEETIKSMKTQVNDLAGSSLVKDSYKGFMAGLKDLENKEYDTNEIKNYYQSFNKRYEEINFSKVDMDSVLKDFNPAGKFLQKKFIVDNPSEKKGEYIGVGDDSYTKVHQGVHMVFLKYIRNYVYYDLFIVDVESKQIIYTVEKEIDIGASLDSEAFENSPITEVFNKAVADPNRSHITDMKKYWPSYNVPAQFVSHAFTIDGQVKGVLIYQAATEKYNKILTGNYDWISQGFGKTGESYLIGDDYKVRTISRVYKQDNPTYMAGLKALNYSDKDIHYVKESGSPATVVSIKSKEIEEAVSKNKPVIFEHHDFIGNEVVTAFKKLKLDDLNWYIVSEMDKSEALEAVNRLKYAILLITAISAVIICVAAIILATTLSNTIINISERLKNGASIVLKSSIGIAEGATELSSTTDQLAASVQETSSSISEVSAMVNKSSDAATNASQLSKQSQEEARKGKNAVGEVKRIIDSIHQSNEDVVRGIEDNNKQIEEINTVIQEISDKTKVINDIVFQTKLLSFNASVEAARAGE